MGIAYGSTDLDAEFRIVLGETSSNRALAQVFAQPALVLDIPPDAETRVDLKRYGLLPVTAARAFAVRHGIAASSTLGASPPPARPVSLPHRARSARRGAVVCKAGCCANKSTTWMLAERRRRGSAPRICR